MTRALWRWDRRRSFGNSRLVFRLKQLRFPKKILTTSNRVRQSVRVAVDPALNSWES